MSLEELLPIILKYTGGFIASSYGLYATLTEFRIEKDGKKVLSSKGYFGIALLVCSSILALTTNAVTDYNDSKKKLKEANDKIEASKIEQQQRREAEERDLKSLELLDKQFGVLKTASKDIGENSDKTQKVSDDLLSQLGITKGISTGLNEQIGVTQDISIGLNKQITVSKNTSDILSQAVFTLNENTETSRKIMNQTDRLMNPIRDVLFSYWITVPLSKAGVKDYRERLDKSLEEMLPLIVKDNVKDTFVQRSGREKPESIMFVNGSVLFPKPQDEQVAYFTLNETMLQLQFYKTPINPEENPLINKSSEKLPDLTIWAGVSDKNLVTYETKTHQIGLEVTSIESNPKYWQSNRKIVSIPDLVNSQVFILVGSNIFPNNNKITHQSINEARSELVLNRLFIRMSEGRELLIFNKDMKKFITHYGYPLYVFTFPENLEQLSPSKIR